MPVIAVVGNKGGAGKTTLSINLSSGMAKRTSTAVVDADPQGSTLQWRAFSDNDEAIPVYEPEQDLGRQAKALLQDYNYVVFDCPPSVHASQTSSVLGFGDVAIIPVQPSPVDLWATVHIERAIEQAHSGNPALRALLVINQLESRTMLSRLVHDALAEIALPVARTVVRRRAVYRNCALEGRSVFDMGRRGADAAAEIDQLIEEVITV